MFPALYVFIGRVVQKLKVDPVREQVFLWINLRQLKSIQISGNAVKQVLYKMVILGYWPQKQGLPNNVDTMENFRSYEGKVLLQIYGRVNVG